MTLTLYDTLAREKRVFAPLDPAHVRVYVCGPTVYDFAHIGNARPVVVFDLLVRLLRRLYPHVTYVRNITDIDDKIIERARESGEDIETLTARCTAAFHADMEALGTLPPDIEPRATDHIAQMIAMARRLIETGNAYVADGHVLFDVPSMPDYGRLSRHSTDELIAGARVEVAPYKKNPADFVLWKPSTADQPGWESPWGRGRPGWHLECSAMNEAHLGPTIDIHGGGQDLIFPHHENEIAQSQCAHDGAPFARFWMHNGYVTVNGEKMSKSLGNFLTVRDLLDQGRKGEAIRLALLAAQYRAPLDFSLAQLDHAKRSLDRWYRAAEGAEECDEAPSEALIAALSDDLNTPQAIAELHRLAGEAATGDAAAKRRLQAAARFMGLLCENADVWFRRSVSVSPAAAVAHASAKIGGIVVQHTPASIHILIDKRTAARRAKDFAKADQIRDELAEHGIILEDKPDGTTDWRRE